MRTKLISRINAALILTIALSISIGQASAAPKPKQVTQIEKQIAKLQKRLDKLFAQLSYAQQQQVIAGRRSSNNDSDQDGVPDLYDGERCDSDSDDDGLSDGDEYENGSDPDDSDSDDDGIDDDEDDSNDDGEDSVEIELKGRIIGITEANVKVSDRYFRLNNLTKYLNKAGQPTSKSEFTTSSCVELEAIEEPGQELALVKKLKLEDDCL